jgi:hypothetical protein
VKGTEGVLRIDFIEGERSGGREASLEEVTWDEWFDVFDESDIDFLYSPEKRASSSSWSTDYAVDRESWIRYPATPLKSQMETPSLRCSFQ